MKRLMAVVAATAVVVAGIAVYLNRSQVQAPEPAREAVESNSVTPVNSVARETQEPKRAPAENSVAMTAAPRSSAAAPAAANDLRLLFNHAIDTLGSAQVDFDEKQLVWKRLISSGQLDNALAELEQRLKDDPRSAQYACALGQGYYKKAGATEDMREKAIFAMKADQTLEAALTLDPDNWDARYIKTVGMTYWPSDLNKGQEVIDQFQSLIRQQEAQSPRPEFARTYLRLGDQYAKGGQQDAAMDIWQRGALLFPNNPELKQKLAPAH